MWVFCPFHEWNPSLRLILIWVRKPWQHNQSFLWLASSYSWQRIQQSDKRMGVPCTIIKLSMYKVIHCKVLHGSRFQQLILKQVGKVYSSLVNRQTWSERQNCHGDQCHRWLTTDATVEPVAATAYRQLLYPHCSLSLVCLLSATAGARETVEGSEKERKSVTLSSLWMIQDIHGYETICCIMSRRVTLAAYC